MRITKTEAARLASVMRLDLKEFVSCFGAHTAAEMFEAAARRKRRIYALEKYARRKPRKARR